MSDNERDRGPEAGVKGVVEGVKGSSTKRPAAISTEKVPAAVRPNFSIATAAHRR